MISVCTAALAILSLIASNLLAATPGITLIGSGLIDSNALDKSGLTGNICQAGNPSNCVPKALFGGFGSALTYTGHDNRLGLCRVADLIVPCLDGFQGICKPLLQLSLANDPKECAEQSPLEILSLAHNHDVYVGRAVGLTR